jgi:hypothetical protein
MNQINEVQTNPNQPKHNFVWRVLSRILRFFVNLMACLSLLVAFVNPLAAISAFFHESGFPTRMRVWFLFLVVEIIAIVMSVIFVLWHGKMSSSGQPRSQQGRGRS